MDNSVLLQFDPLDPRMKTRVADARDSPRGNAFEELFGGPKPTGLKPSRSKRQSINLIDLGASPLAEAAESSDETDDEPVGDKTSRLVDVPSFEDDGSHTEDETRNFRKLTPKPHVALASVQVPERLPTDPFSPPCLVKPEAPFSDTTSLYSSQNTLRNSQSSAPRTPPRDLTLSTNFTPVPKNMHYLPTSSLSSLNCLKMSEFAPVRRRSSIDLGTKLEGRLSDASFDILNGELNLSTMGDVSFTSIGAEERVEQDLPPFPSIQHESDNAQPRVSASKRTARTKPPTTRRKVQEGKQNLAANTRLPDSPDLHLNSSLDTQDRIVTTNHTLPPSNHSPPRGRQGSKVSPARFRKSVPSAPTQLAAAISRRSSIFPSARVDPKTILAGASKSQAVARSLSPGKRTTAMVPEASKSPNRCQPKLAPRVNITGTTRSVPRPSSTSLSGPRALLARNLVTQSTLTHQRTSTIATSRPFTAHRIPESTAPSTRRMSTLGSTPTSINRRESVVPPLPTFPKKSAKSSTVSGLNTRASGPGLAANRGPTVVQRSSSTKSISLTARKVDTSITSSSSASSRTLSSAQPIRTPQVTVPPPSRGLRRTTSVGAASGEGLKLAAARQAIASRPRPSTSLGRVRPSIARSSASQSKLEPTARTSTTKAGGKP